MLKTWGFEELQRSQYVLIGEGGFVEKFREMIFRNRLNFPVAEISAFNPRVLDGFPEAIVLGTDTFQLEMIDRWKPYLGSNQYFVDVSDPVNRFRFGLDETSCIDVEKITRGRILFCDISPSFMADMWLSSLRDFFIKIGFDWVNVHPLDSDLESIVDSSSSVIIWNGSKRSFSRLIEYCRLRSVPVTFCEAGFFPQEKHFYLDRGGVNYGSQLVNDDLHWIDSRHYEMLEQYRSSLFEGISVCDLGYVFVPLQLAHDSNIQRYSKFTQGMQEYIDYILKRYPPENIIFKVHPKDVFSNYDFGGANVSVESALELVAGASLVRGINSSVLYEAALLGKVVMCDGDSLLSGSFERDQRVLAAMVYRQYKVNDFEFSLNKLNKFSNLAKLL